jgi:hypothetical protein
MISKVISTSRLQSFDCVSVSWLFTENLKHCRRSVADLGEKLDGIFAEETSNADQNYST